MQSSDQTVIRGMMLCFVEIILRGISKRKKLDKLWKCFVGSETYSSVQFLRPVEPLIETM